LNVWIHLVGGTGHGSQSGRQYSGETYNFNSPDFYDPYTMRGDLAKLLTEGNIRGCENAIASRREFLRAYKVEQAQITIRRMEVLSYDFWLEVYNADLLFGGVEDLLVFLGADGKLHRIVSSCSSLFEDALKVRNVLAEPRRAFWFTIWHDIWYRNCSIPEFARLRKQLNPWGEQFVGHEEPWTEDQLTNFLKNNGLTNFFGKDTMASIYNKIKSL
jgi:hypothetical protein